MTDFNQSLQDLRESYDQKPLRRSMLAEDPVVEFQKWMQQAIDAKVYDPNACSLATVDDSGRPSSRAVLLKGLDAGRFVFYSNYNSRKAGHLEANPNVSMHFPWFSMQRQVSVLGEVSKVEDALAEEYFQSRPYLSRIGAWASSQSQPLIRARPLRNPFWKLRKNLAILRHALRTGVGTTCIPARSNFGRAGPTVCTTAFSTNILTNNGPSRD